jgi:hypothetical protein
MLDLFFGLKRVVKRQPVHIDNSVFRMHWLFSSLLLAACSLLITSHQYVGQPIDCLQTDRLPTQLLNTYCWMHSTYTLPPDFQGGGEQAHPGIGNTRVRTSPDQAPITARKYYTYYQWVCFALFVQSIFFYLPYYLWKMWEGGLLRSVTNGMQIALISEQERSDKRVLLNQYLYRHMQLHRPYALKYFFCELLCLVNVLAQFWFTDWLFDGDFYAYGFEVITRGRAGLESAAAAAAEQPNLTQATYDASTGLAKAAQALSGSSIGSPDPIAPRLHPMLRMFPRITKCSFHSYGYSGDIQRHDALCLLPLNVLNEKIYLVIWVWFVVLLALLFLVLLYRLLLVAGVRWRAYFLRSRCRLSNESDLMCICALGNIGDWFLLYMLAANIDPLLMHEITTEMSVQLRHRRRESLRFGANYSIASGRSNCSSECDDHACRRRSFRSKWFAPRKSLQDQCVGLLKNSSMDGGKANEAYSASYDVEKADNGGNGDADGEPDGNNEWNIEPSTRDLKLSSRRSADSGVSGSSGGWSWFGCASAPLDLDEQLDRHPYRRQCAHLLGNQKRRLDGRDSAEIEPTLRQNNVAQATDRASKASKANGDDDPDDEDGEDGRVERTVVERSRRKKAMKCMKQLLGSSVNPVLGQSSAINLHATRTNAMRYDDDDDEYGDDDGRDDGRRVPLTGCSSLSDEFSTSQLLAERRHLWSRRRGSLNSRTLLRTKGLHAKRTLSKLRSPLGVLPFSHSSSVAIGDSRPVDKSMSISSSVVSKPAHSGTPGYSSRAFSVVSPKQPLFTSGRSSRNAIGSHKSATNVVSSDVIKSPSKANSLTLKCKSDQFSLSKATKNCFKQRPNQSKR